jgi:DNA-binding HxlR family transcriptional regulator
MPKTLAGVAPNTLSARLKDLEVRGIVARRLYSEHPPRLEYQLTEKGRTLGPVMKALREWGLKQAADQRGVEPVGRTARRRRPDRRADGLETRTE